MDEIEIKTTEVENPQTVEVDISPTGPTYTRGMEAVVRDRTGKKIRPSYSYTFQRCRRCNAELAQKDNEKVVCYRCRGSEAQVYDRLHGDKVAAIINKQTLYKCRECGTEYDDPNRQCCAYSYLFDKSKVKPGMPYRAYQCLGCFTVYEKRWDCCSGQRMISGKFILETPASRLVLGV